jgi:beta-glucosidase
VPADQLALLEEVVAAQPNTVVVVSAGGVLRLAPVHAWARAILGGALLGQAGGGAIADVLTGAVNPSGRVAETFPLRLRDAPSFPHFPGEHSRVRYAEGIFVGYRGYDVRGQDVLYPFGHGLSYTSFGYDGLVLAADREGILARVTVTNTGERAGREVVQLYASVATSTVSRAPRELVGFGSVDLEPAASAVVSVRIERRDLAYWHDRLNRWVVEGGTYRIDAGASSRDIRLGEDVEVDGDDVRLPFTLESTLGELMSDPVGAQALGEALASFAPAGGGGEALGVDMLRMAASIPIGRLVGSFGAGSGVGADEVRALLDSINAPHGEGD